MKIRPIIFLSFLLHTIVYSQVYTGDPIVLSSQAEVDAFGALGYVEIQTSLTIKGPDIVDLSPLSSLEVVETLYVLYNPILPNIEGLDNLKEIRNTLSISYNDSIRNLSGLDGIETAPFYMAFVENKNMESLNGISLQLSGKTNNTSLRVAYNNNLVDITWLNTIDQLSYFSIENNPKLSNCSSLCNFLSNQNSRYQISGNFLDCFSDTQVIENCTTSGPNNITLITQSQINSFKTDYNNIKNIAGYLHISDNPDGTDPIVNLYELNEIESIAGDLIINRNQSLGLLNGLSELNYIGGDLLIHQNQVLTSIEGFAKLTTIDGTISFSSNHSLENIDIVDNFNLTNLNSIHIRKNSSLFNWYGLTKVSSLKSLSIADNANLSFIGSFDNLTTALDISIENNNLSSLNFLPELRTLVSLNVVNNQNLTSFVGLEKINEVNFFYIIGNENLNSFDGLSSLETSVVLFIADNTSLERIDALQNLQTINTIYILNNPNLYDLTGLEKITSLLNGNPGLTIRDNNKLRNLKGLDNLVSCSNISILRNELLESLDGLENLIELSDATETPLEIAENQNLINFCALSNLAENDLDLSFSMITNNAYNPTRAQIIDPGSCSQVLNNETFEAEKEVSIYPNPSKNHIFVEAKNMSSGVIHNSTGLQVKSFNSGQKIDISDLASGMYFVTIAKTSGSSSVQKLLIK